MNIHDFRNNYTYFYASFMSGSASNQDEKWFVVTGSVCKNALKWVTFQRNWKPDYFFTQRYWYINNHS